MISNEKPVKGAKQIMEPELFMARLAEQAERYDDMFAFLQPVL